MVKNNDVPIENTKNILIDYISMDKKYIITTGDFEKVEEYCENECMGIKFLMNANFLRQLVKAFFSVDFSPPFTNDDFKSEKFKEYLKQNGLVDSMVKQFGTDDIELVSKIVIKSTYNFLHKI
ncbi:hypothetical protein [[Eubacterium] cellulosolvens]